MASATRLTSSVDGSKKSPHVGMKLLGAVRSWRSILRERYWQLSPAHLSPYPPSWEIDPQDTRNLTIHWPTHYHWGQAHKWVVHLLRGLGRQVAVARKPLAPTGGHVVMMELVWQGKKYPVAIDYSDYMDQIQHDCLERCVVYFKMQYRSEGYPSNRIVPGGYVNPSEDYYRYLCRLRALREKQTPAFDVYGRFGTEFANETRRRVVRMLESQRRFRYEGSLAIVRYQRSLEEAARASICIDLPGNGDFCFRLIDYLGIGGCIVAARHRTRLHVPLQDRKHLVYAREDLSDLVDLCQYYLEHEEERNQIVRHSREYFDRYLHRDQLAAYYLSTSLAKIKSIS